MYTLQELFVKRLPWALLQILILFLGVLLYSCLATSLRSSLMNLIISMNHSRIAHVAPRGGLRCSLARIASHRDSKGFLRSPFVAWGLRSGSSRILHCPLVPPRYCGSQQVSRIARDFLNAVCNIETALEFQGSPLEHGFKIRVSI